MAGRYLFTQCKITKLSDRQRDSIKLMHRSGYTLPVIGRRFGIDPKRLRVWLIEQGCYQAKEPGDRQ